MQKLPIGPVADWDVGNTLENRKKNRFLKLRACKLILMFQYFLLNILKVYQYVREMSSRIAYNKLFAEGTKQGNSTALLHFTITSTK